MSDETPDVTEIPENVRTEGTMSILPVHTAPNTGKNSLVVKRGPGRPRKVERMPTTSDLEYHVDDRRENEVHRNRSLGEVYRGQLRYDDLAPQDQA